ncbi:MAG: hypothetical protein ACRDN0_31150 [Trebonia sp.]
MTDVTDVIARVRGRLRRQVNADAGHLHSRFFPQEDAVAMTPNDSYLRVWLSELFLARQTTWGKDRSPAVQAMIRLPVGGLEPQTFVRLVQPPVTSARGVFEDFDLTGLLPYRGGAVELQAALYQVLRKNHLGRAIDILAGFSSLLTPLSTALAIAGQVAAGVEKVITANAQDPVLTVHKTSAAPGGGGPNDLVPGFIAVVRATEDELPAGELRIESGRLYRNGVRLTGFDYMVLRIEGRKERDDWQTPDLDQAIRAAYEAKALGGPEEYERLRVKALSLIWTSPSLTPANQRQLAKAVQEMLDGAVPGAVAEGDPAVAAIVAEHGLPSPDSVADLTLADLLS